MVKIIEKTGGVKIDVTFSGNKAILWGRTANEIVTEGGNNDE